jgi:N,N'-diacetylbacillosaminyl-diphospho-undecaprenol alpha-1,3-N-acetylgalactosaminyltransferase
MALKIALICPDGLSTFLFCKGIIKSLKTVDNGHVFVFCESNEYTSRLEGLGVEVVDITYPRWMSLTGDIKYFFAIRKLLKLKKIQLVFNFSTKSNIYGALAARSANVKRIYCHVVGLGSSFQKTSGFYAFVKKTIFTFLYKNACKFSKGVWFTNSNDLEEFVRRNLVDSSKVILSKNYLDVNEYEINLVGRERRELASKICGLKDGEELVVMVARMIWPKGIKEFVEAAKIIYTKSPKTKFVLVAPLEDGSSHAVPEAYIRSAEVSANFKWVGFQEDVIAIYALADLAVLPTFYKEGGYPRGLLEPMAMGKPIITTDSKDCCGVVEEGKNGFLVPIQDSLSLANKITLLLNDSELRDRFGQYGRIKALRDFHEDEIIPKALSGLGIPIHYLG